MKSKYSLQAYIEELEQAGELTRINDFVNPELEITEFADRMMSLKTNNKALLFENTGTRFPLLINHYGNDKRMLMSLGLPTYDEPSNKMEKLLSLSASYNPSLKYKFSILSQLKDVTKWFPKKLKSRGSCQDIIIDNPNLNELPILKCWPYDGGKFITLPLVISEDPDTHIRNIGMYRMQVFDKSTTGMHWHMHKGGATHYNKYKSKNMRMPVSVVLGGDPMLSYCATAPLPENIDEFILAGFLRNSPVKLVKSISNDIYVPENSDFVIEGYVDTSEEFRPEGPFGDHTGFYSLTDNYPIFHITCITHRKDAVYPSTIVGVPSKEDFYFGKTTERLFLKPIQISIAPELLDLRLPEYGVAHNLVFIKIKSSYKGQSFKVMNALLGAGQMMFSKIIICFNENVDIHDDNQVLDVLSRQKNLEQNTILAKGPADVLDHSSYEFLSNGKLLIDASTIDESKDNEQVCLEFKAPKVVHKKNSILVLAVDILNTENCKDYAFRLIDENTDSGISFLFIVDDFDFSNDIELLSWYILNNLDPALDCVFYKGVLVMDASIKTLEKDKFNRDWPNIVCSDDETIQTVDNRWQSLTASDFVESPSLKLKKIKLGDKAYLVK